MKFLILIFFILVSGCGGRVKPDPFPFSVSSNYPSGEFQACGKTFHGLGTCGIQKGQNLESLGVRVRGYFHGSVRAVSKDCNIDETYHYENNSSVLIPLKGPAITSCEVSFVISPIYPEEDKAAFKIGSYEGHLHIKVNEANSKWYGMTTKVPENGHKKVLIPVDDLSSWARVVFRGCGSSYDVEHLVSDGHVSVDINSVVPKLDKQICVLNGFVNYGGSPTRLSWIFAVYSPSFVKLAEPTVYYRKNKIYILADKSVSVISVDEEYDLKSHGTFKAKRDQPHILRALTTGGRSVIGTWDPEGQSWTLNN